jgi:hypothetical protein
VSSEQALAVLDAWLEQRGMSSRTSTGDAWDVAPYRAGFVFSPTGGARSNVLYLVVDDVVTAFSPSTTSIEDAYENRRSMG